jgi:hypothetical protein
MSSYGWRKRNGNLLDIGFFSPAAPVMAGLPHHAAVPATPPGQETGNSDALYQLKMLPV